MDAKLVEALTAILGPHGIVRERTRRVPYESDGLAMLHRLPELVLLQHAAIQHFHLRPNSPACPSKQELIDFFMRVRLSNGSQLRRHLASALATCVRPLSAMAGGRPRKKPRPSNNE